MLVAERGGQVVGFISAFPGHPYAIINELGVLPEYQKGRAAIKLMESMELLLRHLGCTSWAAYIGAKRGLEETVEKWGAVSSGEGTMYTRSLA